MSGRRRLLGAALFAIATALLGLPVAIGQQASLSDQQLKAAFVLNFIRYTEWPERAFTGPEAPLNLCVLGGDLAGTGLSGIGGKAIKGHLVQVKLATNADEARGCHAVFVPEGDLRRNIPILRSLQQLPILTISEADGFIDAGGMIGLVHSDNRLQFEVNLGVVQQAQLKASSQLLRLARNIIEARPR